MDLAFLCRWDCSKIAPPAPHHTFFLRDLWTFFLYCGAKVHSSGPCLPLPPGLFKDRASSILLAVLPTRSSDLSSLLRGQGPLLWTLPSSAAGIVQRSRLQHPVNPSSYAIFGPFFSIAGPRSTPVDLAFLCRRECSKIALPAPCWPFLQRDLWTFFLYCGAKVHSCGPCLPLPPGMFKDRSSGTPSTLLPSLRQIFLLHPAFHTPAANHQKMKKPQKPSDFCSFCLARHAGFEPATFTFVVCYSIQLS